MPQGSQPLMPSAIQKKQSGEAPGPGGALFSDGLAGRRGKDSEFEYLEQWAVCTSSGQPSVKGISCSPACSRWGLYPLGKKPGMWVFFAVFLSGQ